MTTMKARVGDILLVIAVLSALVGFSIYLVLTLDARTSENASPRPSSPRELTTMTTGTILSLTEQEYRDHAERKVTFHYDFINIYMDPTGDPQARCKKMRAENFFIMNDGRPVCWHIYYYWR